jgi:maltose alpha-D-glucosyltransferase/alpha-amylase
MGDRWYKESVIYSLDVDTFQDSDGDGHGDLRGLIARLGYLARLGVTCLWLNPIHLTPNRDDGYDVTDYYGVDPRLGSPGDFAELAQQSREFGLRIILDLTAPPSRIRASRLGEIPTTSVRRLISRFVRSHGLTTGRSSC